MENLINVFNSNIVIVLAFYYFFSLLQAFSALLTVFKVSYTTFMSDITICPKRFSLEHKKSQNQLKSNNELEMEEQKTLLHRSRLHLHNDTCLDQTTNNDNYPQNPSNDNPSYALIQDLIYDNIDMRNKIKKVRLQEENLDRKYKEINKCITAMETRKN